MSSLKLQMQSTSLSLSLSLLLAFADLLFHFKRVSRWLPLIGNCVSWSHRYGNLSFIMETLLECRYFSALLTREAFQSWFISFRLNYWETWPFLKAGYLHSKNSPDFATLVLTLAIHLCRAGLLISSCFSALVVPPWGLLHNFLRVKLPSYLIGHPNCWKRSIFHGGGCWKRHSNVGVAPLLHLGEPAPRKMWERSSPLWFSYILADGHDVVLWLSHLILNTSVS